MIKKVYNFFKEYSENHKMIASFDYKSVFNLPQGENSYCQLVLEDTYSIDYPRNAEDITIAYYLLELPKLDLDDKLELQNKLLEINSDLVQRIHLNQTKIWNEVMGVNAISLMEWNGDSCIGLRVELTLRFAITKNNCKTPLS